MLIAKIILILGCVVITMTDCMQDVKIDIIDTSKTNTLRTSNDHMSNLACQCKLCKGMKIAVATNVVSVLTTAAITMMINYSQCNK